MTPEERQHLEAGLRSSEAFTLRRCQSLLASARGPRPAPIARQLSWAPQRVRHASPACPTPGLASLSARSRRPQRTPAVRDAGTSEPLRTLRPERPRAFGTPRSTWTLRSAAAVCGERGVTPYPGSLETIRHALTRLGVNWRRAKRWSTRPAPHYARNKSPAPG